MHHWVLCAYVSFTRKVDSPEHFYQSWGRVASASHFFVKRKMRVSFFFFLPRPNRINLSFWIRTCEFGILWCSRDSPDADAAMRRINLCAPVVGERLFIARHASRMQTISWFKCIRWMQRHGRVSRAREFRRHGNDLRLTRLRLAAALCIFIQRSFIAHRSVMQLATDNPVSDDANDGDDAEDRAFIDLLFLSL